MRYPVPVDGFKQRPVELETAGLLSGPRLLQNGEPAPKGPKRGSFTLIRDDGTEVVARVRPSFFVDPLPAVHIGDQQIRVVRAFQWYEIAWLGLPIVPPSLGISRLAVSRSSRSSRGS